MFWSSILHPTFKASFQWHTNGEQVTKKSRNSGKEPNPLGDNNRISEEKDTRKNLKQKIQKKETKESMMEC
jgi:hypothetical protein